MRKIGYDVINDVDDVCAFSTPSHSWRIFHTLKKVLLNLGFELSEKKLVPPSTKVSCLGIIFDTTNFTMSIPEDKLQKIRLLCAEWLHKTRVTKKELQSLLGLLLYVSKCIKAARVFLSRMLETLRKNHANKFITLDEDFKKDVRWFHEFVILFNGVSFFDKRPVKAMIELDASLTGLGAVWGEQVYVIPIEYYGDLTIVHLEMLNILVAVRLWGTLWKNHRVIIKCDNQAVVSVLNTGKSSDSILCAIARNILFQCAKFDINLRLIHVLGKNNELADTLSRWFQPNIKQELLYKKIPNPVWCNPPRTYLDINWCI